MKVKLAKFGSAASAVGFSRIFSLVAAVVQLPVLTRMVSTSDYALVSLSIAAGLYFSLISAEPTILPFQRFPGTSDERNNFSFARRRLLMSVGALGGVVLLGGMLLDRLDIAFGLAGWGIGLAFNRFIATAWIMWERPWPYAWTLVLGTGVRVVVLISCLAMGLGATWAVGVAGLLSGMVVLAVAPRGRAVLQRALRRRRRRPWKVHVGISLALGSLAFTVLLNFNLLILPLVASTEVVGVYAAMNQVATLSLGAALGVINTILYPRIQNIWNRGGEEYIRRLVTLLSTISILIGFLSLCFVQALGEVSLHILVGESFSDVTALKLQLSAAVLSNVGQYLTWMHLLNVRPGRIRNVSLIAAVFGSIISWLLIQTFGLDGAGMGILLGFLLYAFLMTLGSSVHVSVRFQAILYGAASLSAVYFETWVFSVLVSVMSGAFCILAIRFYLALRDCAVQDIGAPVPHPR